MSHTGRAPKRPAQETRGSVPLGPAGHPLHRAALLRPGDVALPDT